MNDRSNGDAERDREPDGSSSPPSSDTSAPDDTSESPVRRWLGFAAGLLISAVFVYLTLHKVELGEVLQEIRNVHLPILALSLVTKFLGLVCMTFRSQVLFGHLDRIRFWPMFKSVLVALVGNNILPFRAGELMRVGYLSHDNDDVPGSSALAALALERLLDMFTLALLFVFLFAFALIDASQEAVPRTMVIYGTTGFLGVAMLGAVIVSRYPDPFIDVTARVTGLFGERISSFVTGKIEQFAEGLAGLASLKQTLAVVVWSFLYWGSAIGSFGIWMVAFDLDLPWHAPIVVAIFSAFATVIPSSPGFVGTYHYLVKKSLQFFGVGSATAASFAIVGHATAFIPFTLIGIAILAGDYFRGEIQSLEGDVSPDEGDAPDSS